MATDAGTDIVIAYAYQTDGIGGIVGKAIGTDTLWQLVATDKLEGDWQVFVNEPLHLAFYGTLLLTGGFVVEKETHLTLLALYMGIMGTLAAEEPYHGLV
jgi:hypothetical protein